MIKVPYQEGHLLVACVRVLSYLRQHPPKAEEISEFLGWPHEKVGFLLRGLVEDEILVRVGSAYDERYEIRDHLKLETLPQAEDESGLAEDIKAFDEKMAQEQAKLESLFREGETPAKKKRIASLDDDFKNFQRKGPANPFGDD